LNIVDPAGKEVVDITDFISQFKQADKDGDGFISKEEFRAAVLASGAEDTSVMAKIVRHHKAMEKNHTEKMPVEKFISPQDAAVKTPKHATEKRAVPWKKRMIRVVERALFRTLRRQQTQRADIYNQVSGRSIIGPCSTTLFHSLQTLITHSASNAYPPSPTYDLTPP
jgi:hypothetical protein